MNINQTSDAYVPNVWMFGLAEFWWVSKIGQHRTFKTRGMPCWICMLSQNVPPKSHDFGYAQWDVLLNLDALTEHW